MKKPDPVVHPSEHERLNSIFYRADPAAYLDARLWSLMSVIGEPPEGETKQLHLHYGDLALQWSEEPPEAMVRYASLESTVLLHHAWETLLRLYLAHAFNEPCPWLAVSRLRDPGAFPAAASALRDSLDHSARLRDLTMVFTGGAEASGFTPTLTEDQWDGHVAALATIIRSAVATALGDANYYNAVKHGLAVLAGERGMRLSTGEEDRLVLSQSGPALEILNRTKDRKTGARLWQTSTKWTDPVNSMQIVNMLVRVVRSLWATARWRYGIDPAPPSTFLLERDAVADLLRPRAGKEGGLIVFSRSIYHVQPDDREQ